MTEEKRHTKKRAKAFIERRFAKITEINKKYATPQIKMTPQVKLALLVLRLYLLFLVAILAYKFTTIVAGGGTIGI
jgi:hypothetical protein